MSMLARMRLMQMTSQAFPIGGYSHSLGLEAAIESGLVQSEQSVRRWIADVLTYSIAKYEIPMLLDMHAGWSQRDDSSLHLLNERFLAARESAELRAAVVQMGVSMRSLLAALPGVGDFLSGTLQSIEEPSLPLAWSGLAQDWRIAAADSATAYLWSWAENQVLVAMKGVPIGQSAGQRVLLHIGERIGEIGERIGEIGETSQHGEASQFVGASCVGGGSHDQTWSNFAPGLAILSSQHETQYSRLFRS